MLVAGFDVETTGLDVNNDLITEVGAVLYDTEKKKPVFFLNVFVKNPSLTELSQEIIDLTGIEFSDLKTYGAEPKYVFDIVEDFFDQAEAVVAHNGSLFDRPIYEANLIRYLIPMRPRHWIDSSVDVPYPNKVQTRKLTHLAAEHGFLNPFAHRAVFDVLTMLKICDCYDWNEILRYSKSQTIPVVANVAYEHRDLAKAIGYRWDADRKIWLKNIKEFQFADELNKALALKFNIWRLHP